MISLSVTRVRTEEGRLAESEARDRTPFDAIEAGFCIVEMRFDAQGRAVDYRFVEVDPAFERQTGLRNVAGRWDSHVLAEQGTHGLELLRKPYSVADLSRILRMAVERRGAAGQRTTAS